VLHGKVECELAEVGTDTAASPRGHCDRVVRQDFAGMQHHRPADLADPLRVKREPEHRDHDTLVQTQQGDVRAGQALLNISWFHTEVCLKRCLVAVQEVVGLRNDELDRDRERVEANERLGEVSVIEGHSLDLQDGPFRFSRRANDQSTGPFIAEHLPEPRPDVHWWHLPMAQHARSR